MGQNTAVGGGILISILLGTFCAILLVVLTYLTFMSMIIDKANGYHSHMTSLLGFLIPATYFVSLVMIPYYSFSWPYYHGREECEEEHKKK